MNQDNKERQAEERTAVRFLRYDTQFKSEAIRQRLAAVAIDLRVAAAEAETGREGLLNLASRFERQSRAGDDV